MAFNWKTMVRAIAPTIGTVLSASNPLLGIGIKAISTALLGKPEGTEDEISAAMQKASPEDLLKLRAADNVFKTEMAKIGLDEKKLAFADADSARQRQMSVKDKTPAVLAYLLTVIFSVALFGFFAYDVPEGNKTVITAMLGSLSTVWISALAYFHGSSRGSAEKDRALFKK